MTNAEVLDKMGQALHIGDFDEMRKYLHPDMYVTEAESLPFGGVHRGPDGFIALITRVFTYWDDAKLEPKYRVEDGDRIVLFSELTAKGRKSGESFTMPLSEMFRFQDGQIIEIFPFYFDTKKLPEID